MKRFEFSAWLTVEAEHEPHARERLFEIVEAFDRAVAYHVPGAGASLSIDDSEPLDVSDEWV